MSDRIQESSHSSHGYVLCCRCIRAVVGMQSDTVRCPINKSTNANPEGHDQTSYQTRHCTLEIVQSKIRGQV